MMSFAFGHIIIYIYIFFFLRKYIRFYRVLISSPFLIINVYHICNAPLAVLNPKLLNILKLDAPIGKYDTA